MNVRTIAAYRFCSAYTSATTRCALTANVSNYYKKQSNHEHQRHFQAHKPIRGYRCRAGRSRARFVACRDWRGIRASSGDVQQKPRQAFESISRAKGDNVIKIETDVPLPISGKIIGLLLDKMAVNDSVLLPSCAAQVKSSLYNQMRKLRPSKKFTIRTQDQGIRVWRIE